MKRMQPPSLLRKLKRSTFVRHVLTLISGNLIAKLVLLGAIPVITRIYNPDHIGVQALYFSAIALLSIIAAGRYPMAIVQAQSDAEAFALIRLSIALLSVSTCIVGLAMVSFIAPIEQFLGRSDLRLILYCIPLGLWFTGIDQIFSSWSIRNKRFPLQSTVRVVSAIVIASVQIILGFVYGPNAIFLVGGMVLGSVAVALIYASFSLIHDGSQLAHCGYVSVSYVLRRYRHFPMFTLAGNLFNEGVSDAPVLLMTTYFSMGITGAFAMGRKALGLPVTLIAAATSEVAHQRIAHARNTNQPGHMLILRMFAFMLCLIAGPFLLFAIFAPDIFSLLLGPEWREAGLFARALIPMYAMKFAVQPITRTFLVYEKQLGGLLWQMSYFVISISCLIGARYLTNDALTSVWAYSYTAAAMYLVIMALNFKWAGGSLEAITIPFKTRRSRKCGHIS